MYGDVHVTTLNSTATFPITFPCLFPGFMPIGPLSDQWQCSQAAGSFLIVVDRVLKDLLVHGFCVKGQGCGGLSGFVLP